MSVTGVTVLPQAEGEWDRLYQRRYTRNYRVECSSRADGPVTIRTAVDGSGNPYIPLIGNSYFVNSTEKDLGSFVEKVRFRLEDASANPDHSTWIVTVDYSPYDSGQFGPDPTLWPVIWWWGSQKYEKAAQETINSNPIVNSAGDPFADPVMIDDSRPVLYLERNELCSTFDNNIITTYKDKINDATWNGWATKTVKVQSITASKPQFDSNAQVWYTTVNYAFEFRPEEWFIPVLDQGYAYLDPPGTSWPAVVDQKRVEFKDAKGQRVSKPQLLDGAGSPLDPAADPFFLEFEVFELADFSSLHLDFSSISLLGR